MRLLRVSVATLLTVAVPSAALAQYPVALAPADELSDEDKIEKAKGLYVEAERLAAEDNWEAAVVLYEQAYYLVPGKHGFAHKVGIAAWRTHDCDKAFDYLTHFIEFGDKDKHADKIAEAEGILAEVEAEGCRTIAEPEPEPEPAAVVEDENPFETQTEEPEGGKDKKEKKGNGLVVGGALMLTLGVAGIGVGGAGAAIASGAGAKLDELASTSTNTGYPAGDYACRNPADECPTSLEGKLGTGKALTYAGFIGGGLLLVGGIALIAVHVKKKGKSNANAKLDGNKVELTSVGPTLLPGGAGAAASLRF